MLDYISVEFCIKYDNVQGTEFNIPHGSIIVNIKLDDKKLSITASFVSLPEKGRIPLLRQVASLNFNAMDLPLMKFMYFTQPQGQLLNDMQKAILDMDRNDLPLSEINVQEKQSLKNCKV